MPNWSKSAPDGGWKEQTYYVVEVTFKPSNPPHRAILYTGFWDKVRNRPGGYSNLFQGAYEGGTAYPSEIHTVKPIMKIEGMKK